MKKGNQIGKRSISPQDIKSSALPEVGTMVQFAGKKWIVADIDGEGNFTLMWQDVETTLPSMAHGGFKWSESALRTYLNDTSASGFLGSIIPSTSDQANIVPVQNVDERTSLTDTALTGRTVSNDKVWIASMSQLLGCGNQDANKFGYILDQYRWDNTWPTTVGRVDSLGGLQFSLFVDKSAKEVYDYFASAFTGCSSNDLLLRSPAAVIDQIYTINTGDIAKKVRPWLAAKDYAVPYLPCVKVKPAAVTAIS